MATAKNRRPGPSGASRPRVSGLPRGAEVATMGPRYVARVIDFMVVGVIFLLAAFIGATSGRTVLVVCGALFLLAAVAYEVVLTARSGATLGKKFAAIKVVRLRDGGTPTLGESARRYGVLVGAGVLTAGLGTVAVGLSPGLDKSGRRQGWHDKVAGTIVVED